MLPFRALRTIRASPRAHNSREFLQPRITRHYCLPNASYLRPYSTNPVTPPSDQPIELPPPQGQHPKSQSEGSSPRNTAIPTSSAAALQALKEWSQQLAIQVRNQADAFTVTAKARFSDAGMHLNKVTGYDTIEELKLRVVNQEARITETREAAKAAKLAYEQAVAQRSQSQREVNDLLHRKSSWSDQDVSRFTTLVREDHLFEQNEVRAKAAVDESEKAVEHEFTTLMHTILARYHEEQVWSDKIRSASTYGQIAALGLNLLVFILAIIIVEPWKRKRLAQTFEKKVDQMNDQNTLLFNAAIEHIQNRFDSRIDTLGEEIRQLIPTNPVSEPTAEDTQPLLQASPTPPPSTIEVKFGSYPILIDVEKAKYVGSLVVAAGAGCIIHALIS